MNLNDLNALLAGLGPWGIAAGVALTLLVQWVQRRRQPQPAPDPNDPLAPVPGPRPPSNTPLLDAVLDALRKRLLGRPLFQSLPPGGVTTLPPGWTAVPSAPATDDIDPATAVKLLTAFDAVK